MTITDSFFERLRSIAEAPVTPEIVHQVERCLLDYVGVTYAGRKQIGDKLLELEELGREGNCSVIATEKKKDLITAAMMNGIAAHVIELDDGHRVGAPHLEAVTISAMIAIAQKEQISFERFIKGILIGYEATIRLSTAMQPSLKLKGFHATGVCGTIGAACAVGYAIGLSEEQMKGTISAAASSAAGILQVLDDNSELKPYNVANAIQSGITAAYMGKCRFRGPDDVLGGKRGYLQAYSDQVNMEYLLGETDRPAIFQIYVKPYASCRHSHPAVECALKLKKWHQFDCEAITDVVVQTYKLGIFAHDSTDVSSISSAKMSTPYSVAAALAMGACGMEAFSEEAITRQDIKTLTQKVRITENEQLTKVCPGKRGAIVTICLKDGQVFTETVENPLGEPENNMSDVQLEEKFNSLMTFSKVPRYEMDRIKNLIWDLEENYREFITTI